MGWGEIGAGPAGPPGDAVVAGDDFVECGRHFRTRQVTVNTVIVTADGFRRQVMSKQRFRQIFNRAIITTRKKGGKT